MIQTRQSLSLLARYMPEHVAAACALQLRDYVDALQAHIVQRKTPLGQAELHQLRACFLTDVLELLQAIDEPAAEQLEGLLFPVEAKAARLAEAEDQLGAEAAVRAEVCGGFHHGLPAGLVEARN